MPKKSTIQRAKAWQLIVGACATTLFLLFLLFFVVDRGPGGYFFLPFVFILMLVLEDSIATMRQAKEVREGQWRDEREGASAQVARLEARVSRALALPKIVIETIVSVAVLGGVVALIWFTSDEPVVFRVTVPGVLALGLLLSHVCCRRVLYAPLLEKLKRMKTGAVYPVQVEDQSLVIDLFPGALGDRARLPKPIRLSFSRLHTLKVIHQPEAEAMADYEVGMDVRLAASALKEWVQYSANKLEAPRVFYEVKKNARYRYLYLAGEGLLYVFPTFDDDAERALAAWNRVR